MNFTNRKENKNKKLSSQLTKRLERQKPRLGGCFFVGE